MIAADSFTDASKAHFASQLTMFAALSRKLAEGAERLASLNINVGRSSLAQASENAERMLASRSPQEWLSQLAMNAQPVAEKAVVYGHELVSIASGTQAEFARTAESHLADASGKAMALIDEIGRQGPPGIEKFLDQYKALLGGVGAGYMEWNKAARQATDALEQQLNALAKMFVKIERSAQRAQA
jgi:phasin family protein